MTLQEIYEQSESWEDRLSLIRENRIENDKEIEEYRNVRTQRDTQVGNRPNKIKADKSVVEVNKIPIPFQKNIVKTAASFLFGMPVSISGGDEDLGYFNDAWENMRLDNALLEACESAKAYRQGAILYRLVKDDKGGGVKLKVNALKPTNGTMYPIWDTFDELDAFVWEIKQKRGDESVTITYIFDDTDVEQIEDAGSGAESVAKAAHGFDRIPVVYIEEEQVEYEDVKALIDRYEMRFSKFADTNDYFSSPFFKATGTVDAVPEKDDTGTVYMMDIVETDSGTVIKSDLDVISWDSAPESTKLEFELSKRLIYDLSFTPDLSFENVKGLGNVSGVALRLMFLNSIIKTKFSEGEYKIAVKRAAKLLCVGMTGAKMEGAPNADEVTWEIKFNSILPENIQETIGMLMEATLDKPIMTQKTAVKLNPLVANADDEIADLEAEESGDIGATVTGLEDLE